MPRVLAAAVALAMIARDKQHREVLAWRATAVNCNPWICFRPPDSSNIWLHWKTSAHPGESLRPFAEAVSPNAENQSVLITHRDALADPEFVARWRRARPRPDLSPPWIARAISNCTPCPSPDGRPYVKPSWTWPRCFKTVRAFCPSNQRGSGFTAILGMNPFPFLMPVAGKLDYWIKAVDDFIYAC